MSKFSEWKIKLIGFLPAALRARLKISDPADPAPASAPPNPNSLTTLYAEGDRWARLAIIFLVSLLIAGLGSIGYFSIRLYQAMRAAQELNGAQKEYSHQLGEMSAKINDAASITSIGTATISSTSKEGKKILVSVDIWIKCDSAETAARATAIEIRLRDQAVGVLKNTLNANVDLTSEEGKVYAKKTILAAINSEFTSGKVEEIFFHNLVTQ